MSSPSASRSLAAHILTALVTFGLVAIWLGDRRTGLLNQMGRPIPISAGPGVPPVPPPALPEELLKQVDADEQVNIRVYAAVNRSVVNITTAAESSGFFGEESTGGSGSGFMIDKEGHILTNFHVVEGASQVQVTLYDGSTHEARVIGLDASNDVAVIQVAAPSEMLNPLSLGDSSKLLVGQKILALGNPFGLERTLTTGIISSLDRSLKAKNGRMIKGMIQTDAAINPGNSGGPLLNSRGEVIGINTAIVSQVGQSAGISFAVPINSIQRILKSLIVNGRVIRADLGVTRVFSTNGGLLVVAIAEGGAAMEAGIRPLGVKIIRQSGFLRRVPDLDNADLILAIDGKSVRTVDELLTEVERHSPGDQVQVRIMRGGEEVVIPVRLGQS